MWKIEIAPCRGDSLWFYTRAVDLPGATTHSRPLHFAVVHPGAIPNLPGTLKRPSVLWCANWPPGVRCLGAETWPVEPVPVSWLPPESNFPLRRVSRCEPIQGNAACLPFIRAKWHQVCDCTLKAARLAGVRVMRWWRWRPRWHFCSVGLSLQASRSEEAEGEDGCLPELKPASCHRARFLPPELSFSGSSGLFCPPDTYVKASSNRISNY